MGSVTLASGYFLNWRLSAFILVTPPILLTIFSFILPETPYWLVEKNNLHEARKSLQFLRGKDFDVKDELADIIQGKVIHYRLLQMSKI